MHAARTLMLPKTIHTANIKWTFDRRGARAMEHEARPPARFSSLRSPKNTTIHPLEYAKTANYPPHWLQRRNQSRGGSFLVMLRPARWLERLANPRRRLCAADRPARLRQSLPQPGSPPTRVCYHYSAQPSLAEAGLSPASMSKTEGCT